VARRFPAGLIAGNLRTGYEARRIEQCSRREHLRFVWSQMIDKLEVRVPRATQFRRQFGELYSELCSLPKSPFAKRGRDYQKSGDLRAYGYDLILHVHCIHGKNGDHKVELIDTGKRAFSCCLAEIERVFDIDPLQCGVMRVDCAADVPYVSVDWFHQHVRVRWKQFANEIGKLVLEQPNATEPLQYSQMGKREIQTLYFGKRPNCLRIYDKIAEWQAEYRNARGQDTWLLLKRMQKAGASPEEVTSRLLSEGLNPDAEDCFPTFKETYGVPPTGYTLTRVERQIAGGQVPTIPVLGRAATEWERLDSVRSLKCRLLDYDPYREVQIIPAAQVEPLFENYPPEKWMAGMYLRERIRRQGMQHTRAWLNRRGRNASKLFRTYADFIPPSEYESLTSALELYERYRHSLSKQMAA
jgi:hypothetical protein